MFGFTIPKVGHASPPYHYVTVYWVLTRMALPVVTIEVRAIRSPAGLRVGRVWSLVVQYQLRGATLSHSARSVIVFAVKNVAWC
jgi:hypothetical protein